MRTTEQFPPISLTEELILLMLVGLNRFAVLVA